MYLTQLRQEISQGDVFIGVPFPYISTANPQVLIPKIRTSPAMLLSHSCDFDKPNSDLVVMAAISSLADIARDRQNSIRKNTMVHTLYLQEREGVIVESYVDFRLMSMIPKSIIQNLSQQNNRILSLADAYLKGSFETKPQLGLWPRLAYFFGPRENDLIENQLN